jgi:host factor-I protein
LSVKPIVKKNKQIRGVNMNKIMNLQDVFLNQARKDKISVTIYLTNGFQFKGIVRGFDNYVVILDCEGKQNLVYKHAISTIIPSKSIPILDSSDKSE